MTDQEGYNAWVTRDQEGIAAYLRLLAPKLLGYARRLLGNQADAEEALQEALIAALEKAPDISNGGSFQAWLFRVVHHKAVDINRRKSKTVSLPETEDEPKMFDILGHHAETVREWAMPADEVLAGKQMVEMVSEELERLPRLQREALLLYGAKGLSSDEVASILEISAINLRVTLHRARTALRRLINLRLAKRK